jgi:hypothetical protein
MDKPRYTFTCLLCMAACMSPHAWSAPQKTQDTRAEASATVRFFDDTSGDGHSTCVIEIKEKPYHLKHDFKESNSPVKCKNDHAKSAVLENMEPGSRIQLFSAPGCAETEDWTVLTILKRAPSITVWEFNLDEAFPTYIKRSHDSPNDKEVGSGGVGGDVSCIIIDMPDPSGRFADGTLAHYGRSGD